MKIASGHTAGVFAAASRGSGPLFGEAEKGPEPREAAAKSVGGVPRRDFQCCPPIVKKRSATQHGSPSYSAKFTLLIQKQRRYAHDSNVYGKIISILTMFPRFHSDYRVWLGILNYIGCKDNIKIPRQFLLGPGLSTL